MHLLEQLDKVKSADGLGDGQEKQPEVVDAVQGREQGAAFFYTIQNKARSKGENRHDGHGATEDRVGAADEGHAENQIRPEQAAGGAQAPEQGGPGAEADVLLPGEYSFLFQMQVVRTSLVHKKSMRPSTPTLPKINA